MKRALMISGFTLLVSLAFLSFLPEKTQWISAIFFLVFGIIFLIFKSIKYVKYIAFILIVISVGAFSLYVTDYVITKNLPSYNSQERVFSGYVDSIYTDGFVLKSKLDGEIRSIFIKTRETDGLSNGKACRAVGELTNTSNMSLSDARYYKSKGCYVVCSPERFYPIKDSLITYTPKILKPIWQFREKLISSCDNLFNEDMSGLMKAVLMGDKREVPEKIEDDFTTSGLSHYTALSGQHTSIIAAFLFVLLKGINKRFAAIVTAVSMLFYVLLVGSSFSVTRAGIMSMITYIGMAFFLRSDPLNSLGISIILILAFNPFSASDVSFQLSVVATAGVIIISPRIDKYLENLFSKIHLKLTFIRGIFSTTIGANIALIPYYIFLFERISIVSPLANLVLGPLMALPIVFGTPALILSEIPFVNFLAFPLKIIAELILHLIVLIAKYTSLIPMASVNSGQLFIKIWFVGTILLLACLLLFGNRKLFKLSILLSLTSLFSMILCYNVSNSNNLFVTFTNSYNGTSIVITDKNSCTVLADKTDDFLLYKIEKEIKSYGKEKVDLMIVAKSDNTDELLDFLDRVNVKTLLYVSNELASTDEEKLDKSVNTFYHYSNIDMAVGERMSFTVRSDKYENSIILMKLDEIYLSLTAGKYDLMHSYQEIKNIDMFIIGKDCPTGIEHFQPYEIFLTNEDTAREVYKKIYLLSENITLCNKETIIINKDKYKCLTSN